MVARAVAPLLAFALLATLLAGCSGGGSAPAEGALPQGGDDQDGAGGAGDAAGSRAEAPWWRVGQWWDHHWFFGPQDTQGFTVKSIVTANATDGWHLATDEAADAASHAAFYFHDLGVMGRDWTVRDDGGQFVFPWYDFPLEHNKTWTAREENLDFNLQRVSRDLTLTATAIPGEPGAFLVEARTAEGLRARYDYQPDLAWFSTYEAYDPAAGPDAPYQVRMVTEAHGQGWTGTHYRAQADLLLNTLSVVAPVAAYAQPNPQGQFTITEAHTHVVAVLFSFAAGGASAGTLVAPDGQHWESSYVGDPNGAPLPGQSQPFVFVEAVPGTWRFATAGAATFVAVGGALAWGAVVESGTL